MDLNVEKTFPLPPAIVIELQNGSSTELGSQDQLEDTSLIQNGCEQNQLTNNSVYTDAQSDHSLPESQSLDKKSQLCSREHCLHKANRLLNHTNGEYTTDCARKHCVHPQHCYLGVPNNVRRIRHSKSLRSTGGMTIGECHNHDNVNQLESNLDQFYRSRSSTNCRRADDSNFLNHKAEDLDLINGRETGECLDDVADNAHFSSISGRLNYSSSEASSSHCIPASGAKPNLCQRGCHCQRFANYNQGMIRSDSMADSCRSFAPSMKSCFPESMHNGFEACGSLTRTRTQNPNRQNYLTRSCGNCGKFSPAMYPSRYCINNFNEMMLTDQNTPIIMQRRHTDGSDGHSRHLTPLVLNRRANSMSLNPARTRSFYTGMTSGSVYPSSCINCFQSPREVINFSRHGGFPRSSSDYPKDAPCDAEPKLSTTTILESTDETEVNVKGLCFCHLMVFLVSMQLFLGLVAVALGIYLHWKIPLLPIEECAFWAAVPILSSGLFGCYLCSTHRMTCPLLIPIRHARRAAGALSLISCVVCLVASIFSGQKGSLIANYANEACNSEVTNSPAGINNATNVELSRELQCCSDQLDSQGHTVCSCFNSHNQLLWGYRDISCRYLVSSVKDYLILQSALMAVGAGVCLWLWIVVTEQNFIQNVSTEPTKKQSVSSGRNRLSETTTTSIDGKRFSVDELEALVQPKSPVVYLVNEQRGPQHTAPRGPLDYCEIVDHQKEITEEAPPSDCAERKQISQCNNKSTEIARNNQHDVCPDKHKVKNVPKFKRQSQ